MVGSRRALDGRVAGPDPRQHGNLGNLARLSASHGLSMVIVNHLEAALAASMDVAADLPDLSVLRSAPRKATAMSALVHRAAEKVEGERRGPEAAHAAGCRSELAPCVAWRKKESDTAEG